MPETVYVNFEKAAPTAQRVRDVFCAACGSSRLIRPGELVLIKPNFVAPFHRSATGFDVLEAVVGEVRRWGGDPVIGESSGYEFDTEATFNVLGAYDFARRNGVELINLDRCGTERVRLDSGPVKEVKIADIVQRADVLINVPKLKGHTLTGITLGMKNLFGLLHRDSRREFHSLGLDRGIAEITKIIKSDMVIVDGSTMVHRAVYGREETLGAIVAGTNVYAVDMYCCRLMGVPYRQVGHIRHALRQGLARAGFDVATVGKGEARQPIPFGVRSKRDAFAGHLLRTAYQAMYAFDWMKCRMLGGASVVPLVHFYFGVRPKLDRSKCTRCGKCVAACPVGAIKMPEMAINASLCMKVRCLRCVGACPESAIRISGRDVGMEAVGSQEAVGKNWRAR